MSTKLHVLKKSLVKKEAELERRFDKHFDSVKQANGQPLNDKRDGQATMDKWEKQSDAIRRQQAEVEKTKAAIEREESKMSEVDLWYEKMPKVLTDLINDGTLTQWKRHPRMMFVTGVENARIVFNEDTGVIAHRHLKKIKDKSQYAILRDVYNKINAKVKK